MNTRIIFKLLERPHNMSAIVTTHLADFIIVRVRCYD